MQNNKWSPSQESASNYMGLSADAYSYREAPPPPPPAGPPNVAAGGEGLAMHGLMSMTQQPGAPQPDAAVPPVAGVPSLPPTPVTSSRSPSSDTSSSIGSMGAMPRPNLPARPTSFTSMTTFPSHPYQQFPGPIRKRRAEPIFSFEMGPVFSNTRQLEELLSLDQTNGYQIQLHAKMDRGFFRADQDWACYRRNYFQVSSTFDVLGVNYPLQTAEVPCLIRKSTTHELHQIEFFSIGVSACVSNNPDKKIELVQHTPKRDKGPQLIPKPQPVRAGGNLHLASVGSSHQIVTFERMQFKTATANNGKRRAAQQYYEIVIDLYANTSQGEAICVATCQSAPLVVRGRSPGHYADSHTRYKQNSMTTSPPPPPPPPLSHHHHHHPLSDHQQRLPPPPSVPTAGAGAPSGAPPPNRYINLPTSPVSDFGPYSSYYGYAVAPDTATPNAYNQNPGVAATGCHSTYSMPQLPNTPGGQGSYFQPQQQSHLQRSETEAGGSSDYYEPLPFYTGRPADPTPNSTPDSGHHPQMGYTPGPPIQPPHQQQHATYEDYAYGTSSAPSPAIQAHHHV